MPLFTSIFSNNECREDMSIKHEIIENLFQLEKKVESKDHLEKLYESILKEIKVLFLQLDIDSAKWSSENLESFCSDIYHADIVDGYGMLDYKEQACARAEDARFLTTFLKDLKNILKERE